MSTPDVSRWNTTTDDQALPVAATVLRPIPNGGPHSPKSASIGQAEFDCVMAKNGSPGIPVSRDLAALQCSTRTVGYGHRRPSTSQHDRRRDRQNGCDACHRGERGKRPPFLHGHQSPLCPPSARLRKCPLHGEVVGHINKSLYGAVLTRSRRQARTVGLIRTNADWLSLVLAGWILKDHAVEWRVPRHTDPGMFVRFHQDRIPLLHSRHHPNR